jgi:excisionase family DNA binding protein
MTTSAAHLTYKEVAELLNVKVGTVYSWVARSEIPHVRLGRRVVRFPREQVQQWLAARLVNPGQG